MKIAEVPKKTKCSDCDGVGIVYNPIWDIYYNFIVKTEKIKEHKIFFYDLGINEIPPEEIFCLICDGRGYIFE